MGENAPQSRSASIFESTSSSPTRSAASRKNRSINPPLTPRRQITKPPQRRESQITQRSFRRLNNNRPPLLPPGLQGKDLRFQIRIYAMPYFGGQPLPRRLLTCPAFAAVRLSGPRSVSPVSHTQEQPPVGFIVAFLRQSRRCRSDAGWGSPRIIVHIWRPVSEHTVASALVWKTGALEKHWDEPGARVGEVISSRAPIVPIQALNAKV